MAHLQDLTTEPSKPDTVEDTVTQVVLTASASDHHARDWRFWMIFVCVTFAQFLTALELASVTTALPSIVDALHGEQFVWVGSAYTIAITAFSPLSGNSAQIFGRRATMLVSLVVFIVGSALCGAATSMNFLIAGRAAQRVGSGGIQVMCQIIVSDMIPLRERGVFNGFMAMSFIVASIIGPVVGGSLAQHGQWRWLFYLNIPICGVVALVVLLFLRLRTPPGALSEKLQMVDWIGNLLVIAATTSATIGLTWGGVQYPWSSARILVPLILGLCGLVAFLVFEAFIPKHAIIPYAVLRHRTSASGYLQIISLYIAIMSLLYYVPIYFQACKDASPITSGVDIFGLAFSIAPMELLAGFSVAKTHHYRPQIWTSWVLVIIGIGLFSTIHVDTPLSHVIGFEIIAGAGVGMMSALAFFPMLAPLPVELNAQALAMYMFIRNFANILGVTISGTVLQNELTKHLPSALAQQFPQGSAIAYSIIPLIKTLQEPLKSEVQLAFTASLQDVWQVLIGITGFGFLCSLLMEHLPLHTGVDEKWGLEDRDNARQQSHEMENRIGASPEDCNSLCNRSRQAFH
ncbi:Efflux pump FUS6 [Sparassis crispa]|uniref:Efflux pump FUS6 n=1 Tax=Sparassis crispa TaxID=139825 RepID=A0A401GQ68_9APHY|nr:Efflux pump FUS6 [Sparassis crispa]GBE84300.1 Efflux pump FUS6 [Sparassis crispa]